MSLIIGQPRSKEHAVKYTCFHDGVKQVPHEVDGDGEPIVPELPNGPAQQIDVYLVPTDGRIKCIIENEMMIFDRKGAAKMMTGTATRMQIVHSVVHLDGVTDARDRSIQLITTKNYDSFPSWLLNFIHAKIGELNEASGEDTDLDIEEEESAGG